MTLPAISVPALSAFTEVLSYWEDRKHERAPAQTLAAKDTLSPSARPATAAKALTNAQVAAMVKSGMDDDAVTQAIRSARAVSFDLTPAGQQLLNGDGVSNAVIAAMKSRTARAPAGAPRSTTAKPGAAHPVEGSTGRK